MIADYPITCGAHSSHEGGRPALTSTITHKYGGKALGAGLFEWRQEQAK
jgi:hypothetical protein